jgi:hypothetical protein
LEYFPQNDIAADEPGQKVDLSRRFFERGTKCGRRILDFELPEFPFGPAPATLRSVLLDVFWTIVASSLDIPGQVWISILSRSEGRGLPALGKFSMSSENSIDSAPPVLITSSSIRSMKVLR